MRDNFSKNVKENLAKRVGYLCSNPECSCLTIGPKKGKNGAVNIGVACHITAASEEGPRYNKNINTIQRKATKMEYGYAKTVLKLLIVTRKNILHNYF